MKTYASIFLILTIFLQTFSTYIIEADFFLNQSFIAKTLCINKAKPETECNGKCYLRKKLNEEQQQQSPLLKFEKPVVFTFLVAQPIMIQRETTSLKTIYFFYNDTEIHSIPRAIFHPPTV